MNNNNAITPFTQHDEIGRSPDFIPQISFSAPDFRDSSMNLLDGISQSEFASGPTLPIKKSAKKGPAMNNQVLRKKKARKELAEIIDYNSPSVTMMDIVNNPALSYNRDATRRAKQQKKVAAETATQTTTQEDDMFVFEGGQLIINETHQKPVTTTQAPTRVTSCSFKKITHTDKWDEEETARFYEALQLFGCDFSMITFLFPKRDRAQVKNKFQKEEKISPEKVEAALKSHGNKSTVATNLLALLGNTSSNNGESNVVQTIGHLVEKAAAETEVSRNNLTSLKKLL